MKSLIMMLFVVGSATTAFGQTDPNRIPKPPITQLKIYEPFLGKFKMSSNYGGLQFNGTIEIKPVIKGWYIEQTILVQSSDQKIDREFRQLVTFDTSQNKYRVWRFETLPPASNETTLRTEGADIILEMPVSPMKEGGVTEIFYNRYSMVSSNEMKITSEIRSPDGKVTEHIGVSTAIRIK